MWYLYIMKNKNQEKIKKFFEDMAYDTGISLEDIEYFENEITFYKDAILDAEIQSRIERATDNGYQL